MKAKWTAPVTSTCSALVAIVCPLCIPALGTFLASVGLGFAVSLQFLQPFVGVLLLVSLGTLAWSARLHKRWWVLVVGVIGALSIYGGRYLWYSLPLMVTGAVLLVGVSIMNLRLKMSCACE
jgi:hypothetical protein